MSCIPHLTKVLRARGFRMTPQRLAILQALHNGGHLSPAEVYERVRQTGLTETTVYRTLDFLAANGVVQVATLGNGHQAYELAGETHHHIACRACGAQVEVDAGALQDLVSRLEQLTGFQLDARHLTIFGLCPICQGTPEEENA
jgi:Fur family ferric uptake transcriptional regulator